MERAIVEFLREYRVLVENFLYIGGLIAIFVTISGCIRFSIGAQRRKKGIYPPKYDERSLLNDLHSDHH